MVKNIIDFVILGLLLVRLITLQWPNDTVGTINIVSTVIISIAAGIALSSLFSRGGDDKHD